jgi:hypothetical protein
VIPTTTLLPADTANLGFWVLGQSNVDTRDMLLTNYLSEDQLPLGVRLLNEAGGLEQALSFDGYVYNCTYVQTGDDLFTEDVSVSLVGSGTNFATYVWSNIPVFMTPGAMNFGQSFGTPITGGIPTNVWIRLITMGTNVTLVATGNTNTWGVMPYYATNLNANPQAWLPVTPFNNTLAGDTNTITFTRPTNAAPFFYTIFATNGP